MSRHSILCMFIISWSISIAAAEADVISLLRLQNDLVEITTHRELKPVEVIKEASPPEILTPQEQKAVKKINSATKQVRALTEAIVLKVGEVLSSGGVSALRKMILSKPEQLSRLLKDPDIIAVQKEKLMDNVAIYQAFEVYFTAWAKYFENLSISIRGIGAVKSQSYTPVLQTVRQVIDAFEAIAQENLPSGLKALLVSRMRPVKAELPAFLS